MNQQEVAQLLLIVNAEWPDAVMSEEKALVWTWAFEDHNAEDVRSALKAWIKGGKPFAPRPSDLISILADDPADLAETAWAEVQREASRVGFNRKMWNSVTMQSELLQPSFSTPRISEAVETVGWRTICLGDNSKGEIGEQFMWAYRNLKNRDVTRIKRGAYRPMLHTQTLNELAG